MKLASRSKFQKGQGFVESTLVLGFVPILLTMFTASFYFGEAISSQIRLSNFARYAALKVARGEQINPQGIMDPDGTRIPSFSISTEPIPAFVAAGVNSLLFAATPGVRAINEAIVGNYPGNMSQVDDSQFSLIPAVALMPIGSNYVSVNTQYTIPGRFLSSLVTLPDQTVTASAGIDAQTWTHSSTNLTDNLSGFNNLPFLFNSGAALHETFITGWHDGIPVVSTTDAGTFSRFDGSIPDLLPVDPFASWFYFLFAYGLMPGLGIETPLQTAILAAAP